MRIPYSSLTLSTLVVIGCGLTSSRHEKLVTGFNDRIVLVMLGQQGKADVGKALSQISACGSKLIAINLLFMIEEATQTDTLLGNAIRNTRNVILPFEEEGKKVVPTATLFAEASVLQGSDLTGMRMDIPTLVFQLPLATRSQCRREP